MNELRLSGDRVNRPAARPPAAPPRRGAATLALLALIGAFMLATAPAARAAPLPPARHVVQPGDTLASLARQYGSTVEALIAANGLTAQTPIAVGQTLIAPAAAQPLLPIEAQPRDTLASLAQRHGVKLADLQAINQLAPGQRLAPGQDLLLPARPDQPSPALPPGPIRAITTSPAVVRQGETVAVRIELDASQPASVTLALAPQQIPLRPAGADALVGLAAVHALTEPGFVWLDLTWQAAGETISRTWPIQVVDAAYPTFDIVLPDDKGELLAPELVQAELERMMALWNAPPTPIRWRRFFQRPLAEEFLTSAPFGQRRSYNGGPVSGFHAGQDFPAPQGTPIYAPAPGTVALAEPLQVRGNAVLIDHGGSVFSGYWHLTDIAVSAGQEVQPGDLLGHVGTTGLSTGNHLHWELRVNGFAVDPMQWLTTRFP
ncbi:MAG TPA: peptidoglycan DD-metalloendopeptidase family protein [Anaerolineae bacterium]|nr:peptidoglycan DD-metalloendopeptidase family protein [Anaerolineae bacterium]HNU03160.1 peptidoglycan DD-metalloendopeptidase family protein [Anaerolineae bacterium]